MIPPDIALLGWIVFSFFLMIDRNSVRGFALAMILGQFFLPEIWATKISVLPNLAKTEVVVLGVLIGTFVFHPELIVKFRPHPLDALLVGLLICSMTTSVVNGLGVYDGISNAFFRSTEIVIPICLGRLHLNTPERFRAFLIYLVLASVCYLPFALYEFRMSPQIHTMMYGYFQHVFVQFYRNGFWRPVVCFPHALDLGRFFALCTFLAAFPLRQDLARRYPYGKWMFVAPLVGLIISMSYGPYLMFVVLVGLYYTPRQFAMLAYVIPAAAFLWVILLFMDIQVLNPVVDVLARYNPERAASLQYRLDAFAQYSHVIRQQIIFGYGNWGRGRIQGLATDSKVLIDMLSRGLVGVTCIYGWWFWTMFTAHRLAAKTARVRFGRLAYGMAGVLPICLAFAVFDAALDPHIKWIAGGIIAIFPLSLQAAPVRIAPRRPEPSQTPGPGPRPRPRGFVPRRPQKAT